MPTVALHDGTTIDFTIHGQRQGQGPVLLVSTGTNATAPKRSAGSSDDHPTTAGGSTLGQLLSAAACVVVFDYEAQVFRHPKHRTLTVDTIADDVLAIADAAGIDRFAFYASSWLSLVGPHLATISGRLNGYVMGGFPPVDAPLTSLLDLARRNHRATVNQHIQHAQRTPSIGAQFTPYPRFGEPERSSPSSSTDAGTTGPVRTGSPQNTGSNKNTGSTESGIGGENTAPVKVEPFAVRATRARQFVTFFADAVSRSGATSSRRTLSAAEAARVPRMCFVGEHDVLRDTHGATLLTMAAPVIAHRALLEEAGWTVNILHGTDGVDALDPAAVAGVLIPWLAALPSGASDSDDIAGRQGGDAIDVYLKACGVAPELFRDARLRDAVRALLRFSDNQRERLQPPSDQEPEGNERPRLVNATWMSPHPTSTGPSQAVTASGRTQELLEVRIIRRLNELTSNTTRHRGSQDKELQAPCSH